MQFLVARGGLARKKTHKTRTLARKAPVFLGTVSIESRKLSRLNVGDSDIKKCWIDRVIYRSSSAQMLYVALIAMLESMYSIVVAQSHRLLYQSQGCPTILYPCTPLAHVLANVTSHCMSL